MLEILTTRGQWRTNLLPDLLVLSIRRDEADNTTEKKFQIPYIISVPLAHEGWMAPTKPRSPAKFEQEEDRNQTAVRYKTIDRREN
jgi:hypothetical protein